MPLTMAVAGCARIPGKLEVVGTVSHRCATPELPAGRDALPTAISVNASSIVSIVRPLWLVGFGLVLGGTELPGQAPSRARDPGLRTLHGRVLDERGRPLGGVAVSARPYQEFIDSAALLAAPMTTTAADGTWRLTSPEVQGLAVAALGDGRMVASTSVRYDQARESTMPDLLLLPGAVLTGSVRDIAGKPIIGARVLTMGAANLAGGRSDDAGRFAIPGVAPTGLRVWVLAPGYASEPRFTFAGKPLDVTLHATGFVRGRLVDEHGAPVANVPLWIQGLGEALPWTAELPTTRADGSFTLGISCRGPFRVVGMPQAPTMQSFTSELLHGPADAVVIRDWPYQVPEQQVQIECMNASGGAVIPVFSASWCEATLEHASDVVFQHLMTRRECQGTFAFLPRSDPKRLGVITVEAPGFARELVAEPADAPPRLRIALGPEAVLFGRVVDARTQQPIADAAVLALPAGLRGNPPAPLAGAVRTDAEGRYRIGSLPAGDVAVQVFAAGRPAAAPKVVAIATAAKVTLDLVVPEPLRLTGAVTGKLPPGPPGQLTFQHTYGGDNGCANPLLDWPGTVAVVGAGTFDAGPVDASPYAVSFWLPSRVRPGAGRRCSLGTIDPTKGNASIVLPELPHVIVRGRVHVPVDVPIARIAVLAQANDEPKARSSVRAARPTADTADLAADGSFAFDLPTGAWWFQLVDRETGIVFASDTESRAIAEGGGPIEITPKLHWLELELAPVQEGGAVVVNSLQIEVPKLRDRHGKVLEFEPGDWLGSGDPARARHRVEPRFGEHRHRWLVPAGQVRLLGDQSEWDARNSSRGHTAGYAAVEIVEPVHVVRLTIAPLPFAESRLLAPQR